MMLFRPSSAIRNGVARGGAPCDVSITGISVAYGDTMPVRNLSLDIQAGEFLSLLGPSGCGKTTTLRAVAGFVAPSAGDIRIGGQSVVNIPPNQRSIGMVYQNYALFPHMTVAENIAFGMKMRGFPRAEIAQRIPQLLAQLQLSPFGQRYPKQLSGGQQQRVALARALAFNPGVLLLDEPLAALDKQLRGDMQFELRKLQREVGITTIFVTHDQEEALSLSDRIAVLHEGKILQVGTPHEVYKFPCCRFVAEFIGEANMLQSLVVGSGRDAMLQIDGIAEKHRLSSAHDSGTVSILLRPEKLHLHTVGEAAPAGHNAIPGRIVNSVFVGTSIKYQVQIGSGRLLRVDSQADRERPADIGDEVVLSWIADDARLFRNDLLEA
jgi:spermidine/putrescine ABC transporter ATP-binding subunit